MAYFWNTLRGRLALLPRPAVRSRPATAEHAPAAPPNAATVPWHPDTPSWAVNELDLAFVVDTTGSMGALIAAAQRQMIAVLRELAQVGAIDLRLAVVEYRDHPPQDRLVYRLHGFTGDLRQSEATINALVAQGGGDGPEAVLDGVRAACTELSWRRHARRLAMLVGDAPPHGVGGGGDAFPRGCPCGESIESVSRAAEEARITLYALGLTGAVEASFGALSRLTGGAYFPAQRAEAAIARLTSILEAEFGSLDLDRQVLAARRAEPELPAKELAERLGSTRHAVSASLMRLISRDLLAVPSATSGAPTP